MSALLQRHRLPPVSPRPVWPRWRARRLPAGILWAQLVGFEFGQMQAETLAALADLGALRVTPWRMLLIEGLTDAARTCRSDHPRR